MVKKSMALVRVQHSSLDKPSDYFFASKEKAIKAYHSTGLEVVQWPLVVNGVEQWIEVDE
jgi:hypothetical protein